MPRALLLATLVLLAIAAPAQADLTVARDGNTVVVTGDAGANRIVLQDGDLSAAGPYAIRFYSEDDEPVFEDGDSTCVAEAPGGFQYYRCGNATLNQAAFFLEGGNDRVEHDGDPVFDALAALGIDFGPGVDSNESGIEGIYTELAGGEGDDELFGHDGPTSIVDGGPGADDIVGGGGTSGETLRGGDGNDSIQGLGGDDQIFGDAGADSLIGGADGDTITGGPGFDNVQGDGVPNAFSGNDTLILDDGERDSGSCGFGADTARVDALDLIQDCESVTGGAAGGSPPPSGGTPVTGTAKVALAKPGRLSARRRTLALKVSCPASASGSCSGRVTFTLRFTERGKKRKVSAGSVSFILEPGASRSVRRKLSKQLVRRLRRAKKRTLTARATSRDNAGRSFKSSRTAALKLAR